MNYRALTNTLLDAEEVYDASAKTPQDTETFADVIKQVTNKLTSKPPATEAERAAKALADKANAELQKTPPNVVSASIYLTRGAAGGLPVIDTFYGVSGGKRRRTTAKRSRRRRLTRRRRYLTT